MSHDMRELCIRFGPEFVATLAEVQSGEPSEFVRIPPSVQEVDDTIDLITARHA